MQYGHETQHFMPIHPKSPIKTLKFYVKAASWLSMFLFGVGVSANLTPTSAQQNLQQPRILDELPPPSYLPAPSSLPTFNVPTSPSPPVSPNTNPPEREFNFQAPPASTPPPRPAQLYNRLYRVDIFYGNSPLLLSQVRQIEPEAFVRSGEGVIQAGIFTDEYNAELRVRALAARGLRAKITPISARTQTELESYESRFSDLPPDVDAVSAYFVVIPGDSRDLPNIAAEVVRLGVTETAVEQKEAPRGPHIAVGPFDSRKDAERWGSYFRSVGMDARVYFGK